MRWLAIFIIAIFPSLAQAQLPTVFRPVHLIFDLDWTLFYSIDPRDSAQMDEKVIQVDGKHYRLTDHAEDMFRHLNKNYPEVKISFFSGGEKKRNLQLIRSIRLSSNKTALDIAEHIYHFEDLTTVSEDESLKFARRYKKLAENLIPRFRSEDVILIDDKPEFASPKLTAVSSLGTTSFTKEFYPQRAQEEFFPKNLTAWKLEREKALIWLAHIEEALIARRNLGISFSEYLSRKWTSLDHSSSAHQRGAKIFSRASCKQVYQ